MTQGDHERAGERTARKASVCEESIKRAQQVEKVELKASCSSCGMSSEFRRLAQTCACVSHVCSGFVGTSPRETLNTIKSIEFEPDKKIHIKNVPLIPPSDLYNYSL